MRIALVSGSLSRASANTSALAIVARCIEANGAEPLIVSELGRIPPFVADDVDNPPPSVARFRSELAHADAVVIAAPEYAGGLAGSMKNALDWLVGASTLYRKVIAVMSVGTTGGEFAIEQMVRTLSWQGAYVVSTLGVSSPGAKMTDGEFSDQTTIDEMHDFTNVLLGACQGSAEDRLGALTTVVTSYGIDPARFGSVE